MKQYLINNALIATEQLALNENLTKQDQWNIYKIRKILRPYKEFYDERISALQQKYVKYADEEGRISGEPFAEFTKELEELNNFNVELEQFDRPEIQVVDGISYKIMEPLEEFIEFTFN